MTLSELLESRLAALRAESVFRDDRDLGRASAEAAARNLGLPLLDFSGNDYLGLAALPVVTSAAGAGASRLLHGSRDPHRQLEAELAAWLGVEATLLFSSGYAANLGALASLPSPGDLIVSDELNHASLIDGMRLSRARVQVVPHRDLAAIEQVLDGFSGKAWVVTEAYFSMDGTSPNLPALSALCRRRGAYWLVDEAHSLGAFGEQGRGLCAAAGVVPDVLVGALGKAFGAQGGFVAGSKTLRSYLWNRARTFVFSTATSPALAETALSRLAKVRQAENLRAALQAAAADFERELRAIGADLPTGRHGPIFGVRLGSSERALRVAAALEQRGILAPAIRPPTVPVGEARLRVSLNVSHGAVERARLLAALSEILSGTAA